MRLGDQPSYGVGIPNGYAIGAASPLCAAQYASRAVVD